ncbi:DUF1109 domain-containing protein [Piscinibacter sakaiensis]|uniref:Extracytoplasmic function alternative sigma factor n=1 Tax=Piscinibacter sakaiensis TaxID=1547922 RepID=A0A0K8P2C4_PISS1|nr:DUF1109 domain-containing protein [Piscinibacter sakaiensis]GAP36679.1 extracytoplasmic function alternative sigma factor [Piscinibacter sakaiensis]
MKTEAWIELLARGAGPAPTAVVARRVAPALGLGFALAVALALAALGPVPAAMFGTPAPWIKLAYAAGLATAAAWAVDRLARPLGELAGPGRIAVAVLLAMALLALASWSGTPGERRVAALLGHSWSTCPWNVLVLSLPTLGGLLWALRGLAPTRPRRAGAAAGLLAGAVGAAGYALACLETAPSFIALWYSLGIAMSAGVGALLGPRVLRW